MGQKNTRKAFFNQEKNNKENQMINFMKQKYLNLHLNIYQ